MYDLHQISFRRLTMDDLPTIHHWLNTTPAVNEHYEYGKRRTYEDVVAKYSRRIRGESHATPYVMLYDGVAIGYVQTYLWSDYPEYAKHLNLREEAASLDVFIGHPDYLHRGLGSFVLREFLGEVVFKRDCVQSCVITPLVENKSALRAYEKAGFARLRVIDHPDEPGPVCVMRIGRDELFQRERIPTGLLPRAHYLTEPLTVKAKRIPSFDPSMLGALPDEVVAYTGNIGSAVSMKDGGPNLVLLLEAENGTFVLKVAEGAYRSQELWAEHAAMRLMYGSNVPVPEPLAYVSRGDLSFGLRRYVEGEPLSLVLADGGRRMEAILQMGKLLASIHAMGHDPEWGWQDWVDFSLKLAAENLAAGVYDPDEFTADQPPSAAMEWLVANRPSNGGSVCLLHGDFRPKNIMWADGRITGLIDWQFVDFGDPYYDLSVIHWYMHNEAEWQQLLAGYSLHEFDSERLEYCLVLQKFLNV